jgi:hypothetical protein
VLKTVYGGTLHITMVLNWTLLPIKQKKIPATFGRLS